MVDGSHRDFPVILRLDFLLKKTVTMWPFSLLLDKANTHAHLSDQYHKDGKDCLILENLKI